jgi:hypothetical protein
MPAVVAELSLTLWLMIRGKRIERGKSRFPEFA